MQHDHGGDGACDGPGLGPWADRRRAGPLGHHLGMPERTEPTSAESPPPPPAGRAEVSIEIAAAPEAVWELVADIGRMGEWSPECTGGRWIQGRGPEVGARFVGTNRAAGRVWVTTNRVIGAERGRLFAFDTEAGPLPVSRWIYRFAATEGGTRVTETWVDRRGRLVVASGLVISGVRDRGPHNRRSMEATLVALKAAAEGAEPPAGDEAARSGNTLGG